MTKRRFVVTKRFVAWTPRMRAEPDAHVPMLVGFDLFCDLDQPGDVVTFDMDALAYEVDRRTFTESTRRYNPD